MNGQPIKLRLKEAATHLGIGYSTLRRWISERRIGVEDLGYRTKYIYLTELNAFMRNQNPTKACTHKNYSTTSQEPTEPTAVPWRRTSKASAAATTTASP